MNETKQTAKHTPDRVVDAVAYAMCEYGPDGRCDGAEKIAEAALKACGYPDLLAACEAIVRVCADVRRTNGFREDGTSEWLGPFLHEMEDEATAAIAKARGEA